MAESIVYEHDEIKPNENNEVPGSYRLVKFNDQVISVSIQDRVIKPKSEPEPIPDPHEIISVKLIWQPYKPKKVLVDLVFKNLDTNQQLDILQLAPEYANTQTTNLDVFMYSETILFVGLKAITTEILGGLDYHFTNYGVWIYDLENLTLQSQTNLKTVNKIIPLGKKYFSMVPTFYQHKNCVYPWSKLIDLNNLDEPVYTFERLSQLYPIDWSSSAIEHFSSCAFVQAPLNSSQMDFLDGDFNKIITLGIQDLFPDYQQVSKENSLGVYSNPSQIKISANANCLLIVKFTPAKWTGYTVPGTINIYCWDFTANSQVKFPSYKLLNQVRSAIPFRSPANQIKYFAEEITSSEIWAKVYGSV